MKNFTHKSIAVSLIIAILALSPMFLFAQQKLLGDLSITKNSPEGFVTVNGDRVTDGRSITSPSLIVTSPKASSIVSLASTGTISISPNSKLNLSFIKSSISIDITSGGITVQTVPNTSFNLLAPDGTLTLPVENQENIIKIEVINGRTTVRTLVGEAKFNSTLVSAGEQFPLNSSNEASDKPVRRNDNNAKAYNPILIIGLIGGVAAIALIALSGSSNNDDPPVLSPTR
jgi:hypothetical protein